MDKYIKYELVNIWANEYQMSQKMHSMIERLFWNIVQLIRKAPFTLLRFCYHPFLLHQSYPFTLTPESFRERYPFLCFHIDLPDNKYRGKDKRFCAFTLLRFCEGHCWILERFQKPRFCVFTLIKCVFKNLRFYKFPLLIAFLKTSVAEAFLCGFAWALTQKECFLLRFCTKTEQCERGSRVIRCDSAMEIFYILII